MNPPAPSAPTLDTPGGPVELRDYCLHHDRREWTIAHAGVVLTRQDETRAIVRKTNGVPYGVSLWPGSLALGHEVASRPADFAGRTVLELGSGTGLPGIIAATQGARVVQTDHDAVVLDLCRRNGRRNNARGIEHRPTDWTAWDDAARYDWIIGADVLYHEDNHPHIRAIFAANLAPGGRVLVSDPFRPMSVRLLEALEGEGWGVTVSNWDIGDQILPRPVGVFELVPPAPGGPG